MKLLIVDDRIYVLNGLRNGISWQKEGIEQVFTAENAVEAKYICKHQHVDIILCDIEMPTESGIEFFIWLKEQGYQSRCIFLTSHAEFQYAQQALKLGAFDYVIQPAAYSEVRRVVVRAMEDIRLEQRKNHLYNMGKVFQEQKDDIVANILRNYLNGEKKVDKDRYQILEEMGYFPEQNKPVCIVMFQILRWNKIPKRGVEEDMESTLNNFVSDIFSSCARITVAVYMGKEIYGLVIQTELEEEIEAGTLKGYLIYLSRICKQMLHCEVAMYLTQWVHQSISDEWKRLLKMKDNNVSLKAGIFVENEVKMSHYEFHAAQVKAWIKMLQEGYAGIVEQEAVQLLDDLVNRDVLSADTLRYFYQDYLQVVFQVMGSNVLRSIFKTSEDWEIYCSAMKSVENMKMLVYYITKYCECSSSDQDYVDIVQQVANYINEHLEEELRRDDLAELVHINPDYLTRIFKKELGISLKEYITEQKIKEAQSLLKNTKLPVSLIAAKMGYCNFSHFSYTYKKVTGKTPQEDRARV